MKILSLLFCFMFLDCFSIIHLNIWWAFLWPHLVTSHFAPLQSPSSFYSGLQAWLQLIFRVHVCVTCPDSTAPSYIFQLWAPLGAVMTISVYCLLILWLLGLFAHKFMSAWRGQAVSFCEEPGTDLWLWKFVEWMSDWPKIVWNCDRKPLTWKSEVGMKCVVLVSARPLSVHYANVSMMWRMVYLNLCPFSRKGPLTQGTEFMSCILMLLIKPLSYFLFTVRKFPRFWKVPTLEAWIWHHFSLWAKSWFLSPSSPMSSLTTWSQPARCLWWWRCSRLCGSRAPSTSPWPSRRCQKPSSASKESRFSEK